MTPRAGRWSRARVRSLIDEIYRQPMPAGSDYVRTVVAHFRPVLPQVRHALVPIMRHWLARSDDRTWHAIRIAAHLHLVELRPDLERYREELLASSDPESGLLIGRDVRDHIRRQAAKDGPGVLAGFRVQTLSDLDHYLALLEHAAVDGERIDPAPDRQVERVARAFTVVVAARPAAEAEAAFKDWLEAQGLKREQLSSGDLLIEVGYLEGQHVSKQFRIRAHLLASRGLQ